jgi:hypothetical protein
MLMKYKNENGEGVNVASFRYKSSGYQKSATTNMGKRHYIQTLKVDVVREIKVK